MSEYSDDQCVEEFEMDEAGNPIIPEEKQVKAKALGGKDQKPKVIDETKTVEERRKLKRLEKLDKKIKTVSKRHDKEKKITIENVNDIRNKQKRQEMALMKKMANRREAKIENLKKKKVREEFGEEAMPKGVTKTIESMRVKDETIITDADDEEIKGAMSIDEFSEYFKGITTPRILMTTNRRPRGKIFDFLKEIKASIPGCEYYERKNFLIKDVIKQAKKEGFTALLLFYEKNGIPRKSLIKSLTP